MPLLRTCFYRKDSIIIAAPAKPSKTIPKRQRISNTIGKRLTVICQVPRIFDKQAANMNPITINTKYLRAFTINLNKRLNLLVVIGLHSGLHDFKGKIESNLANQKAGKRYDTSPAYVNF